MTLMRVTALNHDPGAEAATVVLQTETGDRALGFVVPLNEANRLARVLGLTRCRCAPVYDLVLELVAHLEAAVGCAVLDCEAQGICATLVLDRGSAALELPCHPADALALALSARAPIYATADALARACRLDGSHGCGADSSDVAQWLSRVKPDDFGAPRKRDE